MSKSSTLGINQRRHLWAAACRDRLDGMREWTGSCGLLAFSLFFLFSSVRLWFSFSGALRLMKGFVTNIYKQTSTSPVHVCCLIRMRHWWVRRGQDAHQRRRLAETQRLHPGVHGRLPPGRLYLPVLRFHVSSLKQEMRSCSCILMFFLSMENPSMHPSIIHPSNHPSLSYSPTMHLVSSQIGFFFFFSCAIGFWDYKMFKTLATTLSGILKY